MNVEPEIVIKNTIDIPGRRSFTDIFMTGPRPEAGGNEKENGKTEERANPFRDRAGRTYNGFLKSLLIVQFKPAV